MVRWLEANGYDVSYITGVDSDRRGELIKNHKVFLVGRARRVLVGRAARARRGRARRRRPPRVLQRQRRLLEDPLGAQHRSVEHAVPHAGHLQGNAQQRQDRSGQGRLDRHLARLAPVQPGGAEAGERAQGDDLHRQRLAQRSAGRAGAIRADCASGGTPRSRSSRPASRPCSATASSATNGTRTSTTASVPPA